MRPELTKEINIEDFKRYYWLKEELQSFCRGQGINANGSKIVLTNRISTYILTGEVGEIEEIASKSTVKQQQRGLSLDTVITDNHRCTQTARHFFKSVIPKFHFSTFIQNYFKNNVGKTYRDVVNAWYEEEERKKDPMYKKEIATQFEYNRFIRDYFEDPANKYKSRQQAIEKWNEIKKLPGSNKYIPKTKKDSDGTGKGYVVEYLNVTTNNTTSEHVMQLGHTIGDEITNSVRSVIGLHKVISIWEGNETVDKLNSILKDGYNYFIELSSLGASADLRVVHGEYKTIKEVIQSDYECLKERAVTKLIIY